MGASWVNRPFPVVVNPVGAVKPGSGYPVPCLGLRAGGCRHCQRPMRSRCRVTRRVPSRARSTITSV
jgi:hypothetical protein